MTNPDAFCAICGHDQFEHTPVLWPELTSEWELTPDEAAYLDVQQGTKCRRCGSNVRSQALARAILVAAGATGTLEAHVSAGGGNTTSVLELNEAGTLSPWLSRLAGYRFAAFPEHDMQQLSFGDALFDLVVHSDTLEHVPDRRRALAECRRVLAPDGALVFTVPVVVGRLTRSRAGRPASYHGHPGCRQEDYLVHTEFGADVWTDVLAAGFVSCEAVAYRFPAGLAFICRPRQAAR